MAKLPSMLIRWNVFECKVTELLAITSEPMEQLEVLGMAIDIVTGRAPYHFAQNRLREVSPLTETRCNCLYNSIKAVLEMPKGT